MSNPSGLVQILSLVEFTQGTDLVWSALTIPVPSGVVTFSIDGGVFKLGNGSTLYADLPVLFTFNDMVAAQGGAELLFNVPIVAQNGKIVVIGVESGEYVYTISNTSLASLLTSLSTLEANNTTQTATIAALLTTALTIDAGISAGVNTDIVVINNGRYSDSGVTLASVQSQIAAGVVSAPGSHMLEPVWYADSDLTSVVDSEMLYDANTYYLKIPGFNNDTHTPVFTLTSKNTSVVITKLLSTVSYAVFSVKFNRVCGTRSTCVVLLLAAVDDGTGDTTIKKSLVTKVVNSRMLVAVHGGTGVDYFLGVTVDSSNNIICVGQTDSEGTAIDALVVKFDPNLNLLARKRYGGVGDDYFRKVVCDENNNSICVGLTISEGAGGNDALVVKFDTNLNIIARKVYGYWDLDQFIAVALDSTDSIICVGYTTATSAGGRDCLIAKFDANLNLVTAKVYGGAIDEQFHGVAVDSSDNIICVGHTNSELAGGNDCLVVKFDTNLNILARKRYGGAGDADGFYGIAVDSANIIHCVGQTNSEGTATNALVVKFDSNLNILARKIYGGTGSEVFSSVVIDSDNNVVCVGITSSIGITGWNDALVVKFDNNLNILARKIYGGTLMDYFQGVVVDSADSIICAGYVNSAGAGDYDALVVKFPPSLPSGTFVGTILTTLIMKDQSLTLADSALTLTDSTLTLDAVTLTLANSALTLADSTLTLVKDTLG